MGKCRRCGKWCYPHRWLKRKKPRLLVLRLLCTGYWVEEFEYEVCDECSDAFDDFLEGKATPEVERGCKNCGSLKVEDGCKFCPDCGAKVVE